MTLHRLPLAIFVLAALCAFTPQAHAKGHPGNPQNLFVLDHAKLTPAEQVLAESLQGLTCRGKARRIWMRTGGAYQIILDQMKSEGVKIHEVASPWDLVNEFKPGIKGVIIYALGTPSLNAAVSLCGPTNAVAIDESMIEKAKTEGLNILLDARGFSDKTVYELYKSKFGHGTLINETASKPGHLRDLAVARHAFCFGDVDSAFRTQVTREMGPQALVFGWGPSEFDWVADISRGNGTGVPADWCLNLSVLQNLPAVELKRPTRPAVQAETGKRYVAFVMSDGDNVQVLCGGFATDASFWASPRRGEFPMTWEMSPVLADVAPRVLEHYYRTATPNDDFVTGPGAPGYTFLHMQTDRQAIAKQAGMFVRESGLDIVSTLNANEGDMSQALPILDLPEVSAMIYKDYSPYNRRNGEITWSKGKPCMAYRFVLWEKLQEPEDLAREIAKMPTAPKSDIASYALINVHAWSYGKSGGPMEAAKRTIDMLPPNTRVITANQMLAMVKANFGPEGRKP